tara:strand:- start:82861 stop:83988 length:1128 start_codon:yes stop_codon:yes gene_type:complete
VAIAVFDTNTIWRKKPFQALARLQDVVLLEPADPIVAWRRRSRNVTEKGTPVTSGLPVLMPPGWATRWNKMACRRLFDVASRAAKQRKIRIDQVVVTSPHYHPMVRICQRLSLPLFYYGSDDYGLYEGWGGTSILRHEAEIVGASQHSFFVSDPLRQRAIEQYGVNDDRVSLSANATSDEFIRAESPSAISELFSRVPDLKRPVVGVVGEINERIDFSLLQRCLDLDVVGSLLVVGPVKSRWQHQGWDKVRRNPKCIYVGRQPHQSLPVWMQMLDVAIVPYVKSQFNRSCSPMRLYDHLASGKPIVATSACPQSRNVSPFAKVESSHADFATTVADLIVNRANWESGRQRDFARKSHTWESRAIELSRKMADRPS